MRCRRTTPVSALYFCGRMLIRLSPTRYEKNSACRDTVYRPLPALYPVRSTASRLIGLGSQPLMSRLPFHSPSPPLDRVRTPQHSIPTSKLLNQTLEQTPKRLKKLWQIASINLFATPNREARFDEATGTHQQGDRRPVSICMSCALPGGHSSGPKAQPKPAQGIALGFRWKPCEL